jgi:hypothetical protein
MTNSFCDFAILFSSSAEEAMWKRSARIVSVFIFICSVAAAQQHVTLTMRSGSEVEGALDVMDRDSLRILRRVEVDFPMRHERDLPFSYAIRDVQYVDVTTGETGGQPFFTRLAGTVLGTAALAFLAAEAVGKDPEESWPSDGQLVVGAVVAAVSGVLGLIYTTSALIPDPVERYWMNAPADIEALRELAEADSE